jgi:RsiW-degrading membrane proteinase PrsW (M82 family)
MPIVVACSGCGKRLKAPDTFAGKTVSCPSCKQKLQIPEAGDEESATYVLQDAPVPAPPPPPPARPEIPTEEERAEQEWTGKAPPKKSVASLPPLKANEPPLWLRHLHWLLALALLPLAFSLLHKEDAGDLKKRVDDTLAQLSDEQRERVESLPADADEQLFALLPNQKLAGAYLPRKTWAHWLLALGAAVLFMAFFVLLSSQGTAEPLHLVIIGMFTGTAGIMFLLLVQTLAAWSQGVWLRGGSIVVLIFYIVKLIGFSYEAARDPANGFLPSLFGYTFGVGLCEEICKALPLNHFRRPSDASWRTAFIWGLASGAGFGIAEGIMYSGSYYNGIHGVNIYVVRFISCVALHALWTGSVGITLQQRQELIQQDMAWYEYFPPLLLIVGIPMVLHGLYDTLLKREMNGAALVVALLSFLYLAYQISRLHGTDDQAATEDMLDEYQRRREMA